MADLQKVSQVYTQIAYENPPQLKVSQVFVQFAYEEKEVTFNPAWAAHSNVLLQPGKKP